MKNSHELLQDIAKTLEKQHRSLCCKLDSLILASGGTVATYNTPATFLIAAGNTFSSSQVHNISMSVIGSVGQIASISADGGVTYISYPVGYSVAFEATTVFPANLFRISSSSSSSVAVNTIS